MQYHKEPGLYVYYIDPTINKMVYSYYSNYYKLFRRYSKEFILTAFTLDSKITYDTQIDKFYGYGIYHWGRFIIPCYSCYDHNGNYISPYVILEHYKEYLDQRSRYNKSRYYNLRSNGKKRICYGGHKYPKVIDTLRANYQDDEVDIKTTGRARRNNIDTWDDRQRLVSKCWKDQSKKRKQWQ